MTKQFDQQYGYGSGEATHNPHLQLHDQLDNEIEATQLLTDTPDYDAVKVYVENEGSSVGVQTGIYATYVLPASTAVCASVVLILPRDEQRAQAYILAVDAPIVISTSFQEASNIANVGASFPNGGYIGSGWSPKILHNEPVWACNTSTSSTNRVVVMIDR